MYYLYARDISQGIYWRHQVFQQLEKPWQCISDLSQLGHTLDQQTIAYLVWVFMEPIDMENFLDFAEVLKASKCQVLIIQPKEARDLELGPQIANCLIYNEVSESISKLKEKLQCPVTNIAPKKMKTATWSEALTVPLQEESIESSVFTAEAHTNEDKRFSVKLPFLSKKSLKHGQQVLKARLAVMGEDYGAYELAGAASLLGSKTAVIDLDRFEPSMDLRLGISPWINYQYLEMEKEMATGLYVLMDCAKAGPLDFETIDKCSHKIRGYENLYCITGLYQLSDFEYFSANDLERVLEGMTRYFDLIVLRINNFPYDAFTMKAFHWADFIIQVSHWEMKSIRAYKQLISVLREKQQIKDEKHGLILVESEQGESIALGQWFTGVSVLGKIPWSRQRNQNSRYAKSYFKQINQDLGPYYQKIIEQLEVACGTR